MSIEIALNLIILQLALSESGDSENPELALLIKQGDQKAFKTFFEKHHRPLFLFLVKKGMSDQAAEDIIQQAYLLIWEKRDEINPEKSLKSYLFRIAYTRMLNHIRDHSKFSDSDIPDVAEEEEVKDEDQNKALANAIESAISGMPEKRQTVFRLCFIEEFTYKEAAQIMDVSVKTIENHMGLALKTMRESLSKYA